VSAAPYEITPREVVALRDAGEKICLIDCREPGEWALCKIEGANLVPMRDVPSRLQELDAQADQTLLVVYCHHGVRSLNVVHWLRGQGVENCRSMSGGIDLWSAEVDPTVPRY
jgi:rhodanese-related sulfurtransferase